MNIFYLDKDPCRAAWYHHYNHANKMILESAQMLSTAHRLLDGLSIDEYRDTVLYRAAHVYHPCTQWVVESKNHYRWLYQLYDVLGERFITYRGKDHLSHKKLKQCLSTPPTNIPNAGFTEPPACMGDIFKVDNDIVASYRNYYIKTKLFSYWEHGQVPYWVLNKSPITVILSSYARI